MHPGKKHSPKPEAPAVEDDRDEAASWAPPPVRFTVSASPLDDPSVRATLLSRPPAVLSQVPSRIPVSPAPGVALPEDGLEPGPAIALPEYPAHEENLHARLRPAMLILPPARLTTLPDEAPLLLALYVNGIERPRGASLRLRPEAGEQSLGRARDASMALDDNTVSRRHATVAWKRDAWVLRDLGSTCGTFVNGVRVRRARLRDGDRVRLGGAILLAVFDPPIAARVSVIWAQMKEVDVLTGLATQQGFRSVLDGWVDREGPVAAQLLLVALDEPEAIKAAHGDVVLDEVLVALAARLRSLLPTDALGARLVDAHFAWWVEAPPTGGTEVLVQKVTEGVAAAPLALAERSLPVTVSVRGAVVPRRSRMGALTLESLRASLRRDG